MRALANRVRWWAYRDVLIPKDPIPALFDDVLGVLLGPELAGYAAAFVFFSGLLDELVNQVSSVAQSSGKVCCVSGSCRGVIVKDGLKVAFEILIGGCHQRSSGRHLVIKGIRCVGESSFEALRVSEVEFNVTVNGTEVNCHGRGVPCGEVARGCIA